MYNEYENDFKVVFEGELPNGLEVCVWRDVDNGVWEVSVVDPKDIWNSQYDERFRDARSVLEYMVFLREIKKKTSQLTSLSRGGSGGVLPYIYYSIKLTKSVDIKT